MSMKWSISLDSIGGGGIKKAGLPAKNSRYGVLHSTHSIWKILGSVKTSA